MQSSAEALIQTIADHSNSTADILIQAQQYVHLVEENLTRHRISLQKGENDLQQFKEQTRKQQRDQDEILERFITHVVILENRLDQTNKLATRALKRAKQSQSSSPKAVRSHSPQPVASSSFIDVDRSDEGAPAFPIVLEENDSSVPIII